MNKLFDQALKYIKNKKQETFHPLSNKMKNIVIFHIPFNPIDPPSHKIQKVFHDTMLTKDKNHKILPLIEDSQSAPMGINKMIIAYSKQKSLRSMLFPRKIDQTEGPVCSFYLNSPHFKHLFDKK